jgi:hypothetical protein
VVRRCGSCFAAHTRCGLSLERGPLKGPGGAIELGVNFATAAMIIGILKTGWRFRRELLKNAAT